MADSLRTDVLTTYQHLEVEGRLRGLTEQARGIYGLALEDLPVRFDLPGKAAGQFCRRGTRLWYRFNPWVFAADFDHHLHDTVAHEVAHHVVYARHRRSVKPHGTEWRSVMYAFGIPDARATGRYSLEGVPMRQQARYEYRCDCRVHYLTTTRHNRINRGCDYLCRNCNQSLVRSRR